MTATSLSTDSDGSVIGYSLSSISSKMSGHLRKPQCRTRSHTLKRCPGKRYLVQMSEMFQITRKNEDALEAIRII